MPMIYPKKASKIDLSNKGLLEFPLELLKCKNLRKLNLSGNHIKTIPKEINCLKYLQNLDISNNEINSLYANLFSLKFLEVLIIKGNRLKKIPEQLKSLQKLKRLSLAGNQLETLPSEMTLPQLKHLDISKNKFKDFPYQILANSTLTHLWMGKNDFREFDSQRIVKGLPFLRHLYCFGSTANSTSVQNDYAVLQQQKGNGIELLKIISKNNDSNSLTNLVNSRRRIFISYSHKDKHYKEEIEIWLKTIKYIGFEFSFWSDSEIIAGDTWEEKIITSLQAAGIVINIISQYYLASDFIQKRELPMLLEKAKNEGTLVLNIIARKSIFHETKLAQFQAVNDINNPIEGESKNGQDTIYLAMTQRIINEFKI